MTDSKIIIATFTTDVVYQIPPDWSVEDIFIRNGVLYYNNIPQYNIKSVDMGDKVPISVYEDNSDAYFDFFMD